MSYVIAIEITGNSDPADYALPALLHSGYTGFWTSAYRHKQLIRERRTRHILLSLFTQARYWRAGKGILQATGDVFSHVSRRYLRVCADYGCGFQAAVQLLARIIVHVCAINRNDFTQGLALAIVSLCGEGPLWSSSGFAAQSCEPDVSPTLFAKARANVRYQFSWLQREAGKPLNCLVRGFGSWRGTADSMVLRDMQLQQPETPG